jgi:hypothetical protein
MTVWVGEASPPMSEQLPAVRFIRCYDVRDNRMVNRWQHITTENQLRNAPWATEWVITGQTFEEVMSHIEKQFAEYLPDEVEAVRAAYKDIVPAKDSLYLTA